MTVFQSYHVCDDLDSFEDNGQVLCRVLHFEFILFFLITLGLFYFILFFEKEHEVKYITT